MTWKWKSALAALLAAVLTDGCSTAQGPPLPLASNVDLSRMYGGWYIVATIPNDIEKGMVAPYDVYTPRRDGFVREDFYFRKGGFLQPQRYLTTHDEVQPNTGNASWKVQLIWPVKLPFLLVHVDDDYRFALFGERGRDLGWIYAREPQLSDADYLRLKAKFAAVGYDPMKFRKIVQSADQIGRPGFWSDGVKPQG